MNYYQHHIGDFIRDTARLTDSQCMAYLRLMWMYYETEQPLDLDGDSLAFKIGATPFDTHQILKHFFFEHEGKYHHSRCDREILAFRDKSEKAKKSAAARWKNADAMRTHATKTENANECERMRTHKNMPSDAQKIGKNHADAMRTHNERNANEQVFDANQEPIYISTSLRSVDISANEGEQAELAPKDKPAAKPKFDAAAHLAAEGVPDSVAADWLEMRKSRRAAPTLTAINGLKREASKAGMTLAETLALCCERGWTGFSADWSGVPANQRRQSPASNREAKEAAWGSMMRDAMSGPRQAEIVIEGEVIGGQDA